jgi:hypothetical protein
MQEGTDDDFEKMRAGERWTAFLEDEESEQLDQLGALVDQDEEDRHAIAEAMARARLSSFLDVLQQNFEIGDIEGVIIIVGCAAAHFAPGEMLWVRIYGASRSGKTELLRAIATHPDVAEVEAITPASIRGGMAKGHRLLARINQKLVVTKDLAAILTSRKEARNESAGLLRSVKDGKITADFGTTEDGFLQQTVYFDWLIGTTPVYAQYRAMEDLLGARFLDLQWRTGDREAMAQRALTNNPMLPEIRKQVSAAMRHTLDRAKVNAKVGVEDLPAEIARTLADWADLTALLRSPVSRDRFRALRFQPAPEVGTDIAQGFARIAQGLRLLGISDVVPYIARVAWDSVIFSRAELVLALVDVGHIRVGEHDALLSQKRTAQYWELEDMRLLGIVEIVEQGYRITPHLEPRLRSLSLFHPSRKEPAFTHLHTANREMDSL